MQLLRHTPRLERRLHPSVHVEEVTDKVTARGTVLSVGNPARRPRCAFLTFQVMVRLLPSQRAPSTATERVPQSGCVKPGC